MAFTVTMLSWGVIEFGEQIDVAGEYNHALEAIKWGTDYFIKAHTHPNVLWTQVSDPPLPFSSTKWPCYMPFLRKKNKSSYVHIVDTWIVGFTIDFMWWCNFQAGDGETDHYCWQRPEDMTTSRQAYKVDESNPGSDVAGETAAAMASASIVFRETNPHYSHLLLHHAQQVSYLMS